MYTLFSDKQEDFKCKVQVEGSSLSETSARLVLKSSNANLMFEGSIGSDGMCNIPIKGLRSVLNEGDTGTLVLEVIANGTYFSPWSDDFDIKLSKSVQVEVFNDNGNDSLSEMVTVEVQTPKVPKRKSVKSAPMIVAEELKKQDITLSNILKNKKAVKEVITRLEETNKIKPIREANTFIKEIIKYLN